MSESVDGPPDARRGPSVYLIEAGGLYKIGMTRRPVRDRLAELQAGSPVKLTLIASGAGGYPQEAALHLEFRECRQHGEWFRLGPKQLRHAIGCVTGERSVQRPRAQQAIRKSETMREGRRKATDRKRAAGVIPRDKGRPAFSKVRAYNVNDR